MYFTKRVEVCWAFFLVLQHVAVCVKKFISYCNALQYRLKNFTGIAKPCSVCWWFFQVLQRVVMHVKKIYRLCNALQSTLEVFTGLNTFHHQLYAKLYVYLSLFLIVTISRAIIKQYKVQISDLTINHKF